MCSLSTASPGVGNQRTSPQTGHGTTQLLPVHPLDKNRPTKTMGLQGHKLFGTLKSRGSASRFVGEDRVARLGPSSPAS